jgi:Tat protein secretion system quality control protein TatD with DNase activity
MLSRMLLVDTHCHLHLLEATPEEVVAGALAEGVGHLVDVGVDVASSRQAAANAARLPQVSATAGVHPHDADTLDDAALAELRRLLADARVVGVGETGLDYHYDNSPRPAQRAAFAAHVGLARELDKVLVVHCREAMAVVPLERMVLETDSPFLSPHPYRGRPNRPGRVAVTAQTVAEVHGVPVEQVAEITTATAAQAFNLPLDGRG